MHMIDPHDICQIKYPLMNVTVRNNVMAPMTHVYELVIITDHAYMASINFTISIN